MCNPDFGQIDPSICRLLRGDRTSKGFNWHQTPGPSGIPRRDSAVGARRQETPRVSRTRSVWVSGSPDQLRRCVSQSDTVRLLLRRAAQSPAYEPTKPANGSEPMRWAPTRAPAGIDPRTDLIPLAQLSTAYLDQHTSVPGSAQGTSRTPPLVTLVLVSRTSCFRPIHPSWAPRNQESGIPCQGIPLRRSAVRRKIPTFLLNGATNVEETPGSCALAQDFGVSL